MAHSGLSAELRRNFREQVNFYFLKFTKMKRIKDHLRKRHFADKRDEDVPQILKYTTEERSLPSIQAEIDNLIGQLEYEPEKMIIIISADLIIVPFYLEDQQMLV